MMAIPALTFAYVIVDNQGMLIIQVRDIQNHSHPGTLHICTSIKGNATSLYSTHVSEMYEDSVAICKTKTAVYMHGVTSRFVTVPMAYVASLKSGTTFGTALNFAGQLD